MLEAYSLYVLLAGALLGAVGFVWLVVRAFRERALWGLAVFFFPPAGVIFVWRHFRKALAPLVVLLLAGVVTAAPYAVSYYERHFVPLQPYEQVVDGELRITLTGLKDFDYAKLRQKPDTVVLQMANPDVDDHTLENLRGLLQLRELDLSGTQITDAGLPLIAALPRLQKLRLARTKITDEGFHAHLAPKESLVRLDLTGTEVKGKTKRDWKKQQPQEREYVD